MNELINNKKLKNFAKNLIGIAKHYLMIILKNRIQML